MALTLDPILLSDIKDLFEYNRDIYRNVCNMPSDTWKAFTKYPGTLKRIGEKGVSVNVMLKPGHGFGAGSIPPYKKPTEKQATFDIQKYYVRVELERIAGRLARDETVQKIDNYLLAQQNMARFHYNRMLFGDGTGRIAQVFSKAGDNSYINIKPIFCSPTYYMGGADRYFYQGMLVDTFTSGGTQHDNDVEITSVDMTNHRLYGTWTTTVADDYIYLSQSKDSAGVEFIGFPGAISHNAKDGVLDSYGGFKGSDYNNWNSSVLDMANSRIKRGTLYEFCCDIYNNGGGEVPIRCLVTTPAVADQYFEEGTDINRIFHRPTAGMTWDLGIPVKMAYTSPYWGELPILVDPMATEGTIYFVSKAFNVAELTPFDWLPGEDKWGGYFTHTKLLGYDYLFALGVADFTVFTPVRNSHGKIYNIAITDKAT